MRRDSTENEQMRVKNDYFVNSLAGALTVHSRLMPELSVEVGELQPGWITAEALFGDDAAIDEYLDYEGSFQRGADRKTCAAAMMVDYCYIFAFATVPLFAGFGMVPDLSTQSYAMQFHSARLEHDDRILEVRRAHIRFLSPAFWTDRNDSVASLGQLLDHSGLCDLYRRSTEDHMRPLVEKLYSKTGLARNALWRLVGDAIAARFLDAGRLFGCLDEAKTSAMAILKHPQSPLFNRQLHFFELTLRDEEQRNLLSWTFRGRGGCCRYYTVDGGELCETCVLKRPEQRNAELLLAMQRRYASMSGEGIGGTSGSQPTR